MKIKINAIELANILYENCDKIGSTDWDIYTDKYGTLDIRLNTYDLDSWYEIADLYSWWNGDDEFNDFDAEEYGNWLKSDAIDLYMIENSINSNLSTDDEKIELMWG